MAKVSFKCPCKHSPSHGVNLSNHVAFCFKLSGGEWQVEYPLLSQHLLLSHS